ncbi:competence protein CoiA [Lapidilactobacillus wuchangensis]|uniref:competence protein CoiA n=1 Tax=Lapidilactobacillus wuchangensis TaxID=2486001 RepID=UPI0013DE25EC|nr:competence protein CoiA family protein [Lapidilactobacillus wuchangensis]
MYAALQENNVLINAQTDLSRQARYRCPNCRQPVQLVISGRGRAFFRHCAAFSGDNAESHLHEQGKKQLYQEMNRLGVAAKLEVPLGHHQERRADVFWQHHQQSWALEFQCAPLSLIELSERHQSYRDLQVREIWLLGATYWSAQRVPIKAARQFICYGASWGYYLAYWQPQTDRVCLFKHLCYLPPANQLFYQLNWLSLPQFVQAVAQQQTQPPLSYIPEQPLLYDPRLWLGEQLLWPSSSWRSWQDRCYQQGLNLNDLPQILWLPKVLPPTVKRWSVLLERQIAWYLRFHELTWRQRSQLYLQSNWPLLPTDEPNQLNQRAFRY